MTSSQRWMKGVTKKSDFQGIINWGIKGRERGQKWTSFMNNPLVKRQKKIMSFSKRLFSLYSVYNGQVRMTSVLFCYIELSFMAPFWKREVVSWGQKLKIRGHHQVQNRGKKSILFSRGMYKKSVYNGEVTMTSVPCC